MSNRFIIDGSDLSVALDTSPDITVEYDGDEGWTVYAGDVMVWLEGLAVAERLLLRLAAVVCPVSMPVAEALQRIASEALADPDVDVEVTVEESPAREWLSIPIPPDNDTVEIMARTAVQQWDEVHFGSLADIGWDRISPAARDTWRNVMRAALSAVAAPPGLAERISAHINASREV